MNNLTVVIRVENCKTKQHNTNKEYRENELGYDGDLFIIKDINERDAYDSLFGEAVREHDERAISQGHSDRCIGDYLQKLRKNEKKKNSPAVSKEIVVSIGDRYTTGVEGKYRDVAIEVLKEYADRIQENNPNLFFYSISIHADEVGACHLHADFIPFAAYDRGLSVRNSFEGALREMNFMKEHADNSFDRAEGKLLKSAFDVWKGHETEVLVQIGKEFGITLQPNAEIKRSVHYSVEEYKALAAIFEKDRELTLERVIEPEYGDLPGGGWRNLYGSTVAQMNRNIALEATLEKYNREYLDRQNAELEAVIDTQKKIVKSLEEERKKLQEKQQQEVIDQERKLGALVQDVTIFQKDDDELLDDYLERVNDHIETIVSECEKMVDRYMENAERCASIEENLGIDGLDIPAENLQKAVKLLREKYPSAYREVQETVLEVLEVNREDHQYSLPGSMIDDTELDDDFSEWMK